MRKAGRVTSLGKHQLLVELARGGMGVVHLAVMQGPAGFNKLVVIKELPAVLSTKPELVEMFLEEARIAARLNHPNVVQTNEVGSDGPRHYMVMEYLEGQSLRTLRKAVERGPRLPLAVHLHILIDALAGLHHAHELTDFSGRPLNVVHRDVSPHNLFVTYAGVTKVVDFGLARASDTIRNTGSGILRGKLGYMAPEQLRGDPVDRRADVFAVGVMLWEVLAGHRMWRGLNELAVAHLLTAGEIPSLRDIAPNTPDDLRRIVERALAPDVDARYPTAREMQADLEGFLSRQGKHATARGVGTLLSELFRDDRAAVTALVESQLNELREHGARARMVSLVDPEASSSAPRLASGAERVTAPEHTPLELLDDDPSPTMRFDVRSRGVDPSSSSLSSLSPTNASQMPRELARRPRTGLRMTAAVLVLLAGVGIGVAASGAAREPPALAASAPQEPETVRLTVRANPRGARITLDDAARGVGSLEAVLPRDSRTHTLKIEADGYLPATEQFVFSQSVDVRVTLEKLARH